MTRDQAVARIQQGLGFRTDKADEIVLALKEAQRQMERGQTLPRFLKVRNAPLSLLANTQTVNLPSGFLRRVTGDEGRINYSDVTYGPRPRYLPWKSYDDGYRAYAEYNPGGPSIAVLRDVDIYFFPLADRTYSLQWDYYKKGDPLNNGGDTNEWLDDEQIPELLIGTAGMKIARDMQDAAAVQIFAAMEAEARASLFKDTVLEEDNDGPFVLGANN